MDRRVGILSKLIEEGKTAPDAVARAKIAFQCSVERAALNEAFINVESVSKKLNATFKFLGLMQSQLTEVPDCHEAGSSKSNE